MSLFLGNRSTEAPVVLNYDDENNKWRFDHTEAWYDQNIKYGVNTDPLWPRSRIFGGTPGTNYLNPVTLAYSGWTWSRRAGGVQERIQILGQTLNSTSGAVAGANVFLFDTTLRVQVDSQVSDAGGNYIVGSPYGSARSFIVAYKTGSPDSAGTSINNLP